MLPKKLAFVDIETTGCRSSYDRIIEIGIVRVENNKVVDEFSSLVNPQCYLPDEITWLTGITSGQLDGAPPFSRLKKDIQQRLKDCVFVAHNVRFDYAFLRHEFRRHRTKFTSKHFCTVKLSRHLFPEEKKHNLDSIIERFGFMGEARHRALGDASILWDFYQHLLEHTPLSKLEEALKYVLRRPSIPLNLSQQILDDLPEGPGVYLFYGNGDIPLYIGKSVNIRDRVLSHFSGDYASSTDLKIAQEVNRVETIQTAGELGALITESQLIKKLQPLYNKVLRHAYKIICLKKVANKEGYDTIKMEEVDAVDVDGLSGIVGIFRSKHAAEKCLVDITKTHTLCDRLVGLEKTSGACFGYRLGRCRGACVAKEKPVLYNIRVIQAFSQTKIKQWPYQTPISIEEVDEFTGLHEQHIINHWCYTGKMVMHEDAHPVFEPISMGAFDLDLYKILVRYVLDPRTQATIHPIQLDYPEKSFRD